MTSKVAIVELGTNTRKSFGQALKLIGGIDDLNKRKRTVVIKPGIFDHRKKNHPTVGVIDSIIKSLTKPRRSSSLSRIITREPEQRGSESIKGSYRGRSHHSTSRKILKPESSGSRARGCTFHMCSSSQTPLSASTC